MYFLENIFCVTKKIQFMSSYGYKSHVLMIFNQLTSYVEDVLKSYILNEIPLVTTSINFYSLWVWGVAELTH